MKQRAILYTRVSSAQQIENTSLESQEQLGIEYCKRNNIELVKVFVEKGESAKTAERTELKNSLEFCRKEKNIDIFLVYKFDRFSRNRDDHGMLKAILSRYGTQLISMTEKVDDTPAGRLLESMLSSIGQFDNEVRAERTVGGMKDRLLKGYWIFRPPLGYIKNPDEKLIPQPHPTYFPILQKAWSLLLDGYSLPYIENYLNECGVLTPFNKPIKAVNLYKMFHNPFYYGLIHVSSFDIRIIGKHAPMVTEDTYFKAQSILRHNKSPFNKIEINEYILNGVIKCESCHRSLLCSRSKGKMGNYYYYYSCPNKYCEKRQYIKKELAEDKFQKFLAQFSIKGSDFDMLSELILNKYEDLFDRLRSENQAKEQRILDIRQSISRVDNFFEQGVYTIEKYRDRINILENELISLQIPFRELEIKKHEIEEALNISKISLSNLPNLWNSANYQQKRQFIEIFFKEGLVFNNSTYRTLENITFINTIDQVEEIIFADGDPLSAFTELLSNIIYKAKMLNTVFAIM